MRSLADKPNNALLVLPFQDQELTVRSSKYMVFDKKSIPMVACLKKKKNSTEKSTQKGITPRSPKARDPRNGTDS